MVNPGSNIQDTVYFDNFRLDTTPVVDPCAGVLHNPASLMILSAKKH